MISIQIADIKLFMNKLFLSEYFDAFLLSEANFVTFNTFHIDGILQHAYYSGEELKESGMGEQSFSLWKQIRPFALSLIKGTHTPLEFKIIFRLSDSNVEKLLRQTGITAFSPADVDGLFLNLNFSRGDLYCISGTSLTLFSMDKTVEHAWDDAVKKYLNAFL